MQKKKLNLLIVEDRQDDADLVVLELKASGYETTWKRIQTKKDYLENLTSDIDVILADYNLPQFSAPEALRLLQETDLDTPFIILTGSISEEVAVACMKQGATDYLLKDRLSRLSEAIRYALEQRNLRRAQEQAERDLLIEELQTALGEVKTLSGLLPICANCKKIRDDSGYWTQVEKYIQENSQAEFSHSICPDCIKALYPELVDRIEKEKMNGKSGT